MTGADQGVLPLPLHQVGPYLRALQAGLRALAPNQDFVPLSACLDHLAALDPALSGELLLPAAVDVRSGLPSFPWMERALAERALALQGDAAISAAELVQAAALDAALGRRLQARQALHQHLRQASLLPVSRLQAVLKRAGRDPDFAVTFDRMTPGGGWMRVRVELSGRARWERQGPLRWLRSGQVLVDPGLQHLLSRHLLTALLALKVQLEQATGGTVRRLSRTLVGPLWFPGLPLPSAVPDALRAGLLLHLSSEVVAVDVRRSSHRDPWVLPPREEAVPEGYGLYRERRFAASPGLRAATAQWAAEQGMDVVVAPLVPGATR